MSSMAKRPLAQISEQLLAPVGDPGKFEDIPVIKQVASDSTGLRVKDKVVVVTGANSLLGIGRASANQYARNGARAVYICDLVDTHLETQKREILSLCPDVEVQVRVFDASDEQAVKEVIDHAISTYGRLDIFFANAGIVGTNKVFSQLSTEEFMDTLKINVLSVHLAAKYGAPAMKKTSSEKRYPSGSIICTASVAGLRSNGGPCDYSASKSAVISMAQTIAFQLTGTGIRINAICPGLIETGMTAPLFESIRQKNGHDMVGPLNPLLRGGHADEVARVALFLGSEESSYVNGQAWTIDGGMSAGHPYVQGNRLTRSAI